MMKKKLKIILENEEYRLHKMQTLFKQLPKGTLYARTVRGRKYYSIYANGKETWITSNQELVKQFKTKNKLEASISSTLKICSLLLSLINSLPNSNYSDPILTQWADEEYNNNSFMSEHLIFETKKGHLVRSKSERFIADTLFMLKIPYRYEHPLVLGGLTIHPDFTIMKPNGELIIWEHFGLLDNNEYQQNCLRKIKRYNDNGFVQHRNLVCTTENDLQNKGVIEDIIQRFYFS